MGTSDMTPVDLAAVQADDALLNTLGRADVVRDDTDTELARVLVAWRREIDTESFGPWVDTDTAAARISAARRPAPRRHSVLGAVAAAAAVLVVAFAGVGLGAKSAQPGDIWFPLTKVLYSEYARSVEAAMVVETELDQAETALEKGDTSQAIQSLEVVQENLAVIADEQGRDRFETKARKLEDILQGTPSSTEPAPPLPLPSPTSEVPEESVPPSKPTTAPTTSPEPTTETEPPTTDPTTPSSPTVSAEPEPSTAETRSGGGGAGPMGSEESPPPSVSASSG
ncbi:MAG: anti-sigma-D factor RsdA [Pseudonocardiales bacterium]